MLIVTASNLTLSCNITSRKPLDRCNMSGSTEGLQQTLHVWSWTCRCADTQRDELGNNLMDLLFQQLLFCVFCTHHGNTVSMHHNTNVSHFTEKETCFIFSDKQVKNTQHYNTQVSTDNRSSCSTFSKDTEACGGICTSRWISSTTDLYSDIRVKSLKICLTTVGCITINHSIPKPPTAPQTESS